MLLISLKRGRIESVEGILEHHLTGAAEGLRILAAQVNGILSVQQHLAAGGLVQLYQQTPQRTLAAAAFADDAQHLARVQREGYAVHRLHGRIVAVDFLLMLGIVAFQITNLQKRGHCFSSFPAGW